MAEAIGLVASVASLLDLALKLSNALHNLQFQFRNAPNLIQALENETEAIRTVLARVETSIHSAATARLGGPGNSGILGDLTAEIGKGAAALKDLDTFVDCLNNETSALRRVKWVHKRERASGLIKDLKEVRSRISELQLAYSHSSLTRIELVLQDIQLMQRRHYAKIDGLEACLLDTRDQITVDRDTTFQNQSDITAALEAMQNTTPNLPPEWVEAISNQLATSINTMRPVLAKDNITNVHSHRQQNTQAIFSPLQHSTLSLNLRLVQSQCSINCACRCHASVASYRPWNTLPKMLQMIMGSVLFEYSSCPGSRTTCDLHSCSKSRLTRLTVRYGFPFWSFKYAIHILVERASASSLLFTLALRRKVPLEASRNNIIYQAANGNLDAVKRIVFENPTATLDVNHYGDSALCICISRLLPWELSFQICDVLLQAGADPDQVNERGLSFRHMIANLVLQNAIPSMLHSRVDSLIQISPCLEDLDITFIHEIVLKRCPIDITSVLRSGKTDILAQIHSEDRFGMTPLMYAVALGDAKGAEALLEAGASVHKKGPYGRYIVDYAACLPPSTCTALLDLLFTAGADATTVYPSGWTLLHTAALHDNATLMDRLVHEGARSDCFGPRGNRPIHYAAGQNSVNAVRLLYGKGVDLNVLADSGLSPLGVAIQNNAIDTQTLLLELGADHLVSGDWGTLFHLAAEYGSERTLEIMSSFDLKGLDVDTIDAEGLSATDVFENRYDKTDELTKAFYLLKESIKLKSSHDIQDENEVGDMDEFFDAHEFLHYGGSR